MQAEEGVQQRADGSSKGGKRKADDHLWGPIAAPFVQKEKDPMKHRGKGVLRYNGRKR